MRGIDLDESERAELIRDIATRAGTAKEIAKWYGTTVDALRMFVAAHQDELLAYRDSGPEESTEPTPTELGDLWITNKFERLKRLQAIADKAYEGMANGTVVIDAVSLREFRSYLALAANELGQLLHRGSGEAADGETLHVEIPGVNMETLR